MTAKRIVLIIMCAMLLLTVIMAAVVIGKVAPVLGALLDPQEGTVPTEPSAITEPSTTGTADPSTQPTSPTTEATDPPTQPTSPTTEATEPSTQPATQSHEHEFTSLTQQVQATCSAAGYNIYTCSCGQTEMRDYVDPIGHRYGPGQLIAPTCTEEGYTERKCTDCGTVDKQDVKEPTGHNYEETEVREVTCEEDGYVEYKCTGCEDIKREDIVEATGHQMEVVEVVEPGCAEDGYTVYHCTLCEEEIHDDVVGAAGHSFGDWEVTTDPSAGRPGAQSRQCAVCGETEERACELGIVDVRKSESSDSWNYIIKVGAKNAEGEDVAVYTYEVYDYGRFGSTDFAYGNESGLIISFEDNAGQLQTYQLTTAQPLYINEDGEPGIPEGVTPGGEETTAPTEAPAQTTAPSEPGSGD